ncbi:MAG TPA: guanine deaminase [Thiolinea sp.]|nr:guanine deaminase [Thiolinea sp.]
MPGTDLYPNNHTTRTVVMTETNCFAYRASILHLLDDPGIGFVPEPEHAEFIPDGLLVVQDGKVLRLGKTVDELAHLPTGCELVDLSGQLLIPGLIDTHIHYPQTDMIAAYGEQLLSWLETYTFPTERCFADPVHAREVADFFLEQLLRNGTTTALVFGTVHKASVEAFFEAAEARQLRMIAGKVLMDRNCPDYLRDTPESGYVESRELIEKWQGRGRLSYAVTPRFAPTSSPEQLEKARELLNAFPEVYLHTHVAENLREVEWVRELFPDRRSYLDVYYHHGLLRPRSVLAHCIHLDHQDRTCIAETGTATAFCPTSNLFIGSGLFDFYANRDHGIRTGLGTDVGGGTSFSLLQTASEAYKVTQMLGNKLPPAQALYLLTLGGARALYLDRQIGNFAVGKEADFIALRLDGTPLLARRLQLCASIWEKLFVLMMLGDERSIAGTYILGRKVAV